MFQKLALSLLVKAICNLLGVCRDAEGCPDGVCDEPIAELESLGKKLETNNVENVGSIFDFARCLDIPRLVAVVKELIDVLRDARICQDDEGDVITLGEAAE